MAAEQQRPDVAAKRRVWIDRRQPIMRRLSHRLVFLDQTGTSTKMTRLHGRAPRGKRLKASVLFGHWKTETFIDGLRRGGLAAPFVIDRPLNRDIFEAYVKTQLAPALQPGGGVILDNLPAHKSASAKAMIRDRGALLLLPPYSPGLNPIDGLRQAQSPPPKAGRQNHRPPLA